jgi:hypothetical protein
MRTFGSFAAVALIAALDAWWASATASECICRAQGRQFELGQTACLVTPKGPRLATCGMVLNNTSWQFSEVPCTISDASPPDTPRPLQAARDRARAGVALNMAKAKSK